MPRRDISYSQLERDAAERLCDRPLWEVAHSADRGDLPRQSYERPAPDLADITAALTLTDRARRQIDGSELHLIGHALARGATWRNLADALGYRSMSGVASRYRRLRDQFPGYRPPRADAARWAAVHEIELRDAVHAVAGHRGEIDASRMMLAGTVKAVDLEAMIAAVPDPVALYWAAYDAAKMGVLIGDRDSSAGRAISTLCELVTDP